MHGLPHRRNEIPDLSLHTSSLGGSWFSEMWQSRLLLIFAGGSRPCCSEVFAARCTWNMGRHPSTRLRASCHRFCCCGQMCTESVACMMCLPEVKRCLTSPPTDSVLEACGFKNVTKQVASHVCYTPSRVAWLQSSLCGKVQFQYGKTSFLMTASGNRWCCN